MNARNWVARVVCWVGLGATLSAANAARAQAPESPDALDAVAAAEGVAPAEDGRIEAGGASLPPASAEAYDDTRPPGRIARRFSLLVGAGFSHGDVSASFTPEVGFYGRLTEWASIGLRLRGWVGASSLEGAGLALSLAVPSVRLHFREDLSSWASLEVGVHVEGGLALDWRETRVVGSDVLRFSVGVGAFVTLELGEVSSVCLDYTLTASGLGGTSVSLEGAATLSYVARFD